jgi:hypothetical protein
MPALSRAERRQPCRRWLTVYAALRRHTTDRLEDALQAAGFIMADTLLSFRQRHY